MQCFAVLVPGKYLIDEGGAALHVPIKLMAIDPGRVHFDGMANDVLQELLRHITLHGTDESVPQFVQREIYSVVRAVIQPPVLVQMIWIHALAILPAEEPGGEDAGLFLLFMLQSEHLQRQCTQPDPALGLFCFPGGDLLPFIDGPADGQNVVLDVLLLDPGQLASPEAGEDDETVCMDVPILDLLIPEDNGILGKERAQLLPGGRSLLSDGCRLGEVDIRILNEIIILFGPSCEVGHHPADVLQHLHRQALFHGRINYALPVPVPDGRQLHVSQDRDEMGLQEAFCRPVCAVAGMGLHMLQEAAAGHRKAGIRILAFFLGQLRLFLGLLFAGLSGCS